MWRSLFVTLALTGTAEAWWAPWSTARGRVVTVGESNECAIKA